MFIITHLNGNPLAKLYAPVNVTAVNSRKVANKLIPWTLLDLTILMICGTLTV